MKPRCETCGCPMENDGDGWFSCPECGWEFCEEESE